jgi:ABC-type polysaccharide/polyol phosphate export permease
MLLNPIAGAINLIRSVFSDQPIDIFLLMQQLGVAILLLFSGIYVFRKMEAYFADMA